MKIIYRLEEVKYTFYDEFEDENIEERRLLGHFTTVEKLAEAINICISSGIDRNNIFITSFYDQFSSNQKYVYILSHQYSLIENDKYVDYEYIFAPLSNRKKCLLLKTRLQKEKKYAFDEKRFYNLQPPDGFYISKQKINFLYGIIILNKK